uniref:Transcription initiation factor IIE subunit beta n=1 Tax=Chlamydomonas leiostraca TaxID=1034604 RepID=A0A7S0R2K2_9CHLO|mmetsp:Transcript_12288/g.30029  ORF Transcript_12288/g.30029 Transcript_12288/m.30029 type:complete len:325 (+) Transcript_12288:147-1121(+)
MANMNPKLAGMLNQFSAGQANAADTLVDMEKQRTQAEAVKPKIRLKGSVNGFVPAPKQDTAANRLRASTAASAAPLDPTTAPLGKRVKDVMDCLHANNGTQLTPAELLQKTGHNLASDMELLRELHTRSRVTWEGAPPAGAPPSGAVPAAPAAWYAYRPEIEGVRDKVTLLNYVRDLHGRAALASTLRNTYLAAQQDLLALRDERKIFIIGHPEPDKETVFAVDVTDEMTRMDRVGEDVRALWFEVTQPHIKDCIPRSVQELQAAVTKHGLRSAIAHQPVKRAAPGAARERQKKPRQQRFNINKATNAHLPFLFSGAAPKSLDS